MRSLATLALTLLLAGCASGAERRALPRPMAVMAAQGEAVARTRCGGCHTIDGSVPSPRQPAPTFRELNLRFNALTWERRMREIARDGHDEMPPLSLPDAEVRQILAYVQSRR